MDILYRDSESEQHPTAESDDSDNIPLCTRLPCKITPSELHSTLGDNTTKIVKKKRIVAGKSMARKAKEPRPTLAPQWDIILEPSSTIHLTQSQ